MNAELSNILQQRILLNKIDNALAYYALTHLSDVRHAKRIQLSGFNSTSYDMKLVCPVDTNTWQQDVRHAKRKQLSRCLCNIVHMYVGISCGVWQAQGMSYQMVCRCGTRQDVERHKWATGIEPKFWAKKNPRPFGQGLSFISYEVIRL